MELGDPIFLYPMTKERLKRWLEDSRSVHTHEDFPILWRGAVPFVTRDALDVLVDPVALEVLVDDVNERLLKTRPRKR